MPNGIIEVVQTVQTQIVNMDSNIISNNQLTIIPNVTETEDIITESVDNSAVPEDSLNTEATLMVSEELDLEPQLKIITDKLFTQYESMFSKSKIRVNKSYLIERYECLSKKFNKNRYFEVAENANRGFEWPQAVYTRDLEHLRACGSIENLIREVQLQKRNVSFNSDRVREYCSGDPEYERLLQISNGVVVDVPDNFSRRPLPTKFRYLQSQMTSTYRSLYLKSWTRFRGVILPIKELSPEQLDSLHFSDSHWTSKVDSESGRILLDTTNCPPGMSLKSEDAKVKIINRYGKATCPTIIYILRRWISFCQNKGVLLSACLIWKDDIESAFPQLNLEPKSAMLLSTKIDEELIFINSSGSFGWQGMPMAFGCLSRVLQRLTNDTINGVADYYVDDDNALSLREHVASDHIKITKRTKNFEKSTF